MTVRRTGATLTAAAVLATAPFLVQPAAAVDAGGVGIRLLDAPVDRKDDPRARTYVVDHVHPGATIKRRIEVTNEGSSATPIAVYAAAANLIGGNFVVADGRTSNELASWITATPASAQLSPGGRAQVSVEVRVPAGASPGERYAAVLAEIPAKPSGTGTTVGVATRVGVRVYLDVGPGGEPASDFRVDTLTAVRAADGTPEVTARITNTGGRAIDLGGTLALSAGPGGLRAGPFPVDSVQTLAVKASDEVLVKLDKSLPVGPWHARIDMQSGRIKRAAEATITFPAANGTAAAPVQARAVPLVKNRKVLIPLAAGLIVLVLVVLAGLYLRAKQRSKLREKDQPQ